MMSTTPVAFHIIVTIPKSDYHDPDEIKEALTLRNPSWWLPGVPRQVSPGKSRIYFQRSGHVDSSMRIDAIESAGESYTTGRIPSGACILRLSDYREEDHEYRGKGFGGCRYHWPPGMGENE